MRPWSELMQRVWREDVLSCPRCGGRLRLIALIRDEAVAARILQHLGLSTRAPPRSTRTPLRS